MKTKGFYFSLSRLLAHWCGCDAKRSEKNYFEANLVGTFIHVVALAFGFRFLLARFPFWQEVLLVLPLALVVWIFWLLFFYFASLLTKAFRTLGIMREISDARAQSVLIGTVTTVFAFALIGGPRAFQIIGMVWIAAVALNIFAALLLAFTDVPAAE